MAFLKIENVKMSGISACVPKNIEENSRYLLFDDKNYRDFVAMTGVERKRKRDSDVCLSDLCVAAAQKLIADLQWNKEEISFLLLVTQSQDYILPATSIIIQDRLGLPKDCFALDISLGCSGWVYGMSVISSLLSIHKKGKGLLLAGDVTVTNNFTFLDKSTYPLFGDAGTVTAFEYAQDASPQFYGLNSDGGGYKAIIQKDGANRNPTSASSFIPRTRGEGIVSNDLSVVLDGMDVFSFGIKRAPESVNQLCENFNLDKEKVDYFTFHQANKFMNEQIRKKLKLPPEKVSYSLKDFGNTSSASIPLTMVTELKNELETKRLNHIACGFGVGLSWGSVYFNTQNLVVSPLVEV
ncbi:MAG: ketoacyl-ACP synthase III [Chitinivibrionia bacterium]|nr:ketoacyl-ACP synthase III [Chitinivibrionia bacterium]